MNWKPNQEQHMQDEHYYGSYTGTSQQPSSMQEQTYDERRSGYYQPGVNVHSYVVYDQPQPFPTGQSLSLGSVAAILSYAGGWFTGLLFFLFAGQNRYVRFHALQSLLFFGAINLLDIAFISFGFIGRYHLFFPYLPLLAFFAFFLLNVLAFFGWLIAMIQAARGRYYKLPFVGAFVEQCLSRHVILK